VEIHGLTATSPITLQGSRVQVF